METAVTRRWLFGGAALFCLAISLYYAFCEKVPINNGFGWDGVIYADLVKNFETSIVAGKIDSYYIQRVLPAILVALPSRLLGIPVTPAYIINGFVVANIINIVVAVVYWLKTANWMNLSGSRTMIGFLLLFATFPVLKFNSYLPVITDGFAFSTAMMMMYYYLKRNSVVVALMVFLASFIWAGTFYLGVFLLCFPRGSRLIIPSFLKRPVPVITAFLTLLAVLYTLFIKKTNWSCPGMITPLNMDLLPLSIALLLTYVFWCSRLLIEVTDKSDAGRFSITGVGVKPLLMGAVTLGGSLVIQKSLAGSAGYGFIDFVTYISWNAVKQPAIFLVASIAYYASAIVFLLLNLKGSLQASRDLGLGFILAVMYALALGIGSESRFYINLLPFIVLAVVVSGPFDRLDWIRCSSLMIVQIVASKLWLIIGATSQDLNMWQSHNAQHLFMTIGPWMSNSNYLIHLCAGITVTVLLWLIFKRQNTVTSPDGWTE